MIPSTIPLEDHQNGGNRSRGSRQAHGHLNKIYEALHSYRDEAVEDVEGGGKPSECILVFSWLDLTLTSSL